ncbi:MAG TPA: MFS transporter [Micromonosporaceae bacterium]|nr:MFS transporter [Micromonosporaceae bacterium]
MVASLAGSVPAIQRRTIHVLIGTQIIGGVGAAVGISVGALLAAELAGVRASGLAGSAAVVGAAMVAIPATAIMRSRGRRPGLAFGYLVGALGAALVVAGVLAWHVPLFFTGMVLFGGGSTAGLQARYAAVDLAEPHRRSRQLAVVLWATTVGAVAGPNLAPVAERLPAAWRLPEYAGAFLLSALAFLLAAAAALALLRPDPLLTARRLLVPPVADGAVVAAEPTMIGEAPVGVRGGAWRQAVAAVRASPAAVLGISAVVLGHLIMVSVMSMTPVQISAHTTGHASVLRVVGLVLSVHIAGMYALSPVVGWLSDVLGRRRVILGGVITLLVACVVAGTAGAHTAGLAVGLALLGLGWCGTMVAGSTLLSESVAAAVRPAVQGLSDVVMGLAAASGGAVAGVIVDWLGYRELTLLAAAAALPLIGLALRARTRG